MATIHVGESYNSNGLHVRRIEDCGHFGENRYHEQHLNLQAAQGRQWTAASKAAGYQASRD
jgi:hypothetical protein